MERLIFAIVSKSFILYVSWSLKAMATFSLFESFSLFFPLNSLMLLNSRSPYEPGRPRPPAPYSLLADNVITTYAVIDIF